MYKNIYYYEVIKKRQVQKITVILEVEVGEGCDAGVGDDAGGDAGGGDIVADSGECDDVDIDGVTDVTAAMLASALTSSTGLEWINTTPRRAGPRRGGG